MTPSQKREAIAARFTAAREKAGITKIGLTEMISISRRQIQRLERGEGELNFRQLKALSKLYGVSIDHLLLNDTEEQ
jgi:transcriptional regulator with XRE-family HTH domain